MINDAHVHVLPTGFCAVRNHMSITDWVKIMNEEKIASSVVMLNPFILDYMCDDGHIVHTIVENNKPILKCVTCNENIASYDCDPYRVVNIALLNEAKRNPSLYPFVYITACKETFQSEMDFFEEHYKNDFYGFKFINSFNGCKIKDFGAIKSSKPILFHTSNDVYSNPLDIINIAKDTNVPVILAHLCSLDLEALRIVNDPQSNFYTDLSPLLDLKANIEDKATKIFPIWNNKYFMDISSDNAISSIINSINKDKVLWGSDSPWGNVKAEIDYFKKLGLSESDNKKILETNFNKIIKINNNSNSNPKKGFFNVNSIER